MKKLTVGAKIPRYFLPVASLHRGLVCEKNSSPECKRKVPMLHSPLQTISSRFLGQKWAPGRLDIHNTLLFEKPAKSIRGNIGGVIFFEYLRLP